MSQNEMPFIAQYLISCSGFSPDRALRLSIKSSDRPEAVMKFSSDTGLSDTQIRAAILIEPIILACNADKNLKPRVREWVEHGFSEELVVQLIRYDPTALVGDCTAYCDVRQQILSPNLLFWRDFVSNDVDLLKIIPRIGFLILHDIDKYVAPKISILKEYGLSNQDIVGLLADGSRCMSLDVDSLRQTIELIEELGLKRGTGMFLCRIKAVGSFSKDQILKNVVFYKTAYGWSRAHVHCAFRKFPNILQYSEEKIESNMDFLITKAKVEPRSIISQPKLLGYSVEKRLVPRHHVLSIRAANGLKKNCNFVTAFICTEEQLLEKYVEPYNKEDVPKLTEAYIAASGKTGSL